MSVIEHATSLEQLVTIEEMDLDERGERLADLMVENAKLRELVQGYESLAAALCNDSDCTGCPFDSTAHVLCEHMRLVACMGELGVEVDE